MLSSLRRLLGRIYEIDPTGLSRLLRLLVRTVRLIFLAPREFLLDRGLQWAGSLAFSTLLALVPIGVLVVIVADLLTADEVVDDLLNQILPRAASDIGPQIEQVVQSARDGAKAMGIAALGFLLFVAYGLFADLERAVAHLWKTRRGRTLFGRLRAFGFLLLIGPLLFGGSIGVTARIQSWAQLESTDLDPVVVFLLGSLSFAVTWIAFYVLYSYLPIARVRVRSAILSAIVAGSSWEIAKRGFNLYVANAVTIDQFYGPVGIVLISLLWLYLTWIIVLFGVEMAYVDQNFDAIVHGVAGHGAERGAARELAAVRLVEELALARRSGGRPPEVTELGRRARLRPETAQELLEAMRRSELVAHIGRRRFRLLAEDNAIRLVDVIDAVRGSPAAVPPGGDGADTRLDRWFAAGESARAEALDGRTIADLLDAPSPGDSPTAPALEADPGA